MAVASPVRALKLLCGHTPSIVLCMIMNVCLNEQLPHRDMKIAKRTVAPLSNRYDARASEHTVLSRQ